MEFFVNLPLTQRHTDGVTYLKSHNSQYASYWVYVFIQRVKCGLVFRAPDPRRGGRPDGLRRDSQGGGRVRRRRERRRQRQRERHARRAPLQPRPDTAATAPATTAAALRDDTEETAAGSSVLAQ